MGSNNQQGCHVLDGLRYMLLQHPQPWESNLLRVNKMCVKATVFTLFAGDYSLTCEQETDISIIIFVCKCLSLRKKFVNPCLDKGCLSSSKHNHSGASKIILPLERKRCWIFTFKFQSIMCPPFHKVNNTIHLM